ncbi:MAG TPA: flagellar hook-associated protein FlgK [Bryobacteraceae bacterium]|nr:flagellar hook-associated protein FlgK [Bryobacteraceae bacterium]
MGSLLTSLLNSAGALRVYDRAFNVIENNVTNANTPGYVSQDQSLVAMTFNPAAGLGGGVMAGDLISARSAYLDQAVRSQTELLGGAQQQASDLAQIQPFFDTTGASGVPGALTAFFNSVSQLSVNPNDEVSRQGVIDASQTLAQRFNQNAGGIQKTAANVGIEIRNAVSSINDLAAQIAGIDEQFRASPDASHNAGLDAQLNAALEQLSQFVHYTALKSPDGGFTVFAGGQAPLVIGAQAYALSADFSAPQTAVRDSQGKDITAQLQNNGGTLGALLQTANVTLPGYVTSLNTVAQSFADAVNNQLSLGVDRNGNPPAVNLFQYNAALGAAATLSVTNIAPDRIAAATAAAPGGNGNALAIAQLATQPLVNGFTVTQAYGNLGGQVGRDIADAQQEQTAQQNLLDQAHQQRAAATGVSLNAEAAKLLEFQQAYQAVGKLVTTLDSLTQTVIDMVK